MNKHSIHPGFFFVLAAAIIVIPLPWLVAWAVAVGVHELCHLLAVRLFGYEVGKLRISGTGMSMQTDVDSPGKMMICSLAGPLGGLALLAVRRVWPMVAICGLIHSLYNMLPIRPLDGGCIVECFLRLFLKPDMVEKALLVLEWLLWALFLIFAVWAFLFWGFGIAPLIMLSIFLHRRKKYLANKDGSQYNSNSYL